MGRLEACHAPDDDVPAVPQRAVGTG